jgi:hypothetical protein
VAQALEAVLEELRPEVIYTHRHGDLKMEMRTAPHSRSLEHVKALATHRDMSVGIAVAEAFMVVRLIKHAVGGI